jgi:transposase
MPQILSTEKRVELEKLSQEVKTLDEMDRLRVILAYDKGRDVKDIVDMLKISKATVYNYINQYIESNKVANEPTGGSHCHLTERQQIELIAHLYKVTYLKAEYVCAYVLEKYNVKYSADGMTDWLKRNGFVYKKPVKVPAKLDPEKQAEFIKLYEELKSNLKADEGIMFMDAVHPEYQSQAVCGWIPEGETKTIPTTNKQTRLHINGVIELSSDASSHKIFTQEYSTIDAQSIIAFFKKLLEETPYLILHIICDNGRANKNKELDEFLLQNQRLKIHYLPPYSPNLNPIERLWKVMRESLCYNQYYEKYVDFQQAVRGFFDETIHQISPVLKSRINDNFQIITHNTVQL